MPLNRGDVESALLKKGFQVSNSDHKYYVYYTTGGKKTGVFTKTSHGTGYKTLSDDLVGKMAKQCGLTTSKFKDFVACHLSQNGLEIILVEAGRIKI